MRWGDGGDAAATLLRGAQSQRPGINIRVCLFVFLSLTHSERFPLSDKNKEQCNHIKVSDSKQVHRIIFISILDQNKKDRQMKKVNSGFI